MKLQLKRPDQKESALLTRLMVSGVPMKFYTGKTIQCKNWSETKQEVFATKDSLEIDTLQFLKLIVEFTYMLLL